MATLMSPTASSEGTQPEEDESLFDVTETESSGTTDDEAESAANEDNLGEETEKCEMRETDTKEAKAGDGASDAPEEEMNSSGVYKFAEQFLPKLLIMKVAFEVDAFAGCIVIGSTIVTGGINSMKTATSTLVTAAMLELIVNHAWDKAAVTALVVKLILLEVTTQFIFGLTRYAERRARRPLQKRLSGDLMIAFNSLPYQMMQNKDIAEQFQNVCILLYVADDRHPGYQNTLRQSSLEQCP
jgi:hypothetical protein